jgi:hypothetical protein
MANKQKPMGEQEILTRTLQEAKESVGWYDSRLSKERQRVINYRNSALPRRQSDGNSSYVSSDVYDSTEAMKAQIVETFSANPDNLISFPPLGQDDIEPSREATEYCNHVFFIENDGEGIIQDVVHDGLHARVGVVKVYWEDKKKHVEETFSGLSYADTQGLAAQQDVANLDADIDQAYALKGNGQPTYNGKLTREYDISGVCVDPVAPEEFGIKPRSRSIEKALYCDHHTLKARFELLEMGYPAEKVNSIQFGDEKSLDMSPEVLAREAPTESSNAVDNAAQKEVEHVMFYESYIRLDIHDGRGVRLWKVCHAGGVLLSKEEVDRAPFKAFVPLRVSHTFYGDNFAARVIPTQNARTVLTRGILDHTAATTNPRYTVLKGGLLNPREMLDNRLRGIVNINRPDAVKPLEQANLNPFVFQTIEMLKQNKEESTGISSLSQGMNKDAISTQNSAALVDNLVTLSTQRQKIVARNFAKFMVEVYLEIYRLVLENQDKEKAKVIAVAGNFVPVKTKDWIERTTCKVAVHLGYGERDRMAMKYQALYKELASDPAIGPMFSPQNRYNLITDGMRAAEFERWNSYITPPQQVQPPQPDPKVVAETQAKVTTANAAMTNAQANMAKATHNAEMAEIKERLAELSVHMKAILGMRAEARKDAETENKIEISQREMALAEATPPGTETAVVAPRG